MNNNRTSLDWIHGRGFLYKLQNREREIGHTMIRPLRVMELVNDALGKLLQKPEQRIGQFLYKYGNYYINSDFLLSRFVTDCLWIYGKLFKSIEEGSALSCLLST